MPATPSSFEAFYQAYLDEHRHPMNRALHLASKVLAFGACGMAAVQRSPWPLLAAPFLAVLPCWLGHLAFEANRPLSWEEPAASLLGTLLAPLAAGRRRADPSGPPAGPRPYYSLLADLRMCSQMVIRRGAAGASART